ncbi:protein of unknown function DUF4220, partial [Cynara cardunculus var. scolymus]
MRRMMADLFPKWKRVWDTWDLQGFIILSLSLQTFLILFAPLRKRTKSNWIIMPLWSAYLLADWAANFAVGLISNSQGNPNSDSPKSEDLLAFWAPFLLVHLGGPDTITAFALEDNELWLRHLLGLMFQCLAAVYVFVQSLPENQLWVPTLLIIEMIREPDRAAKSANKAKKGNLTELEIVQYAHAFFENFKGLVVDMIFSRRERNQSRDFFLNRTAKDAFDVIEVELNFIYEALFTKLPVVYGYLGAMNRVFSLATISLSIVLFFFKNKSSLSDVDITITYGLLFGALALDVTALFMLVFSDLTIISLRKSPDDELDKSIKTRILTRVLRFMTEGTVRDPNVNPRQKPKEHQTRKPLIRFLKRRWSESVSTYNLIDYCLHPRSSFQQFVVDNLGLSGFLDGIEYVKPEEFTVKLRDFIFKELKSKSDLGDDLETAKEISLARGDWVLRVETGWGSLLQYTLDADYDQSLLLWHIATELCYNNELNNGIESTDQREIAKLLSDYMLYLLIMQPSMMSAIAGIGQIRFRDTCAEAKRFFESGKGREVDEDRRKTPVSDDPKSNQKQINACMEILKVETEVPPATVKGDRSKSLLFDGCILAKKLMNIEKKNKSLDKWLIISKVWVELLCYAASHSRANSQAAQVSRG